MLNFALPLHCNRGWTRNSTAFTLTKIKIKKEVYQMTSNVRTPKEIEKRLNSLRGLLMRYREKKLEYIIGRHTKKYAICRATAMTDWYSIRDEFPERKGRRRKEERRYTRRSNNDNN